MDKYIGRLLDNRYEILEKIGSGGMSDVYKAKCHKLNRFVAVKVLKQEFNENTNKSDIELIISLINELGNVLGIISEKEKEILTAQALNEGKPANIAEKMVNGRIAKYYKEVCLLEQAFIKDDDITVAKYVENTAKELGGNLTLKKFVRFEKGEGLEKREDNFADEVASMVK